MWPPTFFQPVTDPRPSLEPVDVPVVSEPQPDFADTQPEVFEVLAERAVDLGL